MNSDNSQKNLYFQLKIKLITNRIDSQEQLNNQKIYNLSNASDIAKYQLDYLFLDLFYNLIEDFLFAHNIVFDDFDVSCFTSPEYDYLIKISYLRTPWNIIQKLRDMTCLFPNCSEEIYQNKLCSSHFQEYNLNKFNNDDLLNFQKGHLDEDKKLYQEYLNQEELKEFYKKINQDIPLVINFPVFDNYQQLSSILDQEEQEKIKNYENNLDDNQDNAPLYLNFFLNLQPENLETDKLLEIEFPFEEQDDYLSDSDISIDNLSEISLELESENIVNQELNKTEDENLNQLILDCNPLENLSNSNINSDIEDSDVEDSDVEDSDSDIDLDNDKDFQKLKEEIEKRIN